MERASTEKAHPMANRDPQAALSVEGLTKSFAGAPALRDVTFQVHAGSTHALIGPNGAGKSTLIKILDGVETADAGTVAVTGTTGPGRAGVVHQDLALVEVLTIRENLQLSVGGLTRLGLLLDHGRERTAASEMLKTVRLEADPETEVGDLTLGERSLVAIARLLSSEADVIVLDETTAALTRGESEWLYQKLKPFTDAGGALVVVSHRLHEIVENCDHVTLLKDGKVEYNGKTPSLHDLHDMFVSASGVGSAREVADARVLGAGSTVLLNAAGAGADRIHPFDLQVHAGEVVGLVGSLASSLYEVAYLLAGRGELREGRIHRHRKNGGNGGTVGFLAEDRQRTGNLTGLRVEENLTVGALSKYSRGGWINRNRERLAVAEAISEMTVVPARPDALIGSLSGGNQQKVLFGRAMLADPDVYVLCEPTRGVDVQTRLLLYGFIRQMATAGAAVVIATVDVDDAMAVSDRIAFVGGADVEPARAVSSIHVDELLARLS
jgi:ribose transport system ATP-binding protein